MITGHGTIDGRPVCVFSQDFTVFGGSLGEVMGEKICKLMDLAARVGCPVIGINDSGGARIQEGVVSLGAYAELFYRNVRCSGVIPQISLIMGPCAGGAVYSPAITDFILMVRETSHMFITGPDVIKTVTGESVGFEELGGAMTHNTKSGVAHFATEDEDHCLEEARYLLSFLPQNNLESAPVVHTRDDPRRMDLELDRRRSRQPTRALRHAHRHPPRRRRRRVPRGSRPSRPQHRLRVRPPGRRLGRRGRQPARGARRRARHRRLDQGRALCADLRRVQHPGRHLRRRAGLSPGTAQEWGGIIRHGAKLLYAYAEATVPKITVITRKAYGGAYDVMSSKHLRADFNFAWPTAEIAVMGPEGAVNIIYRRELAASAKPDKLRAQLMEDYTARFENPYVAAERGYIDDVIEPHETRPRLITALHLLATKHEPGPRRKHGNIPL